MTARRPSPRDAVRVEMPEEKIRMILKISKELISKETPIGEELIPPPLKRPA